MDATPILRLAHSLATVFTSSRTLNTASGDATTATGPPPENVVDALFAVARAIDRINDRDLTSVVAALDRIAVAIDNLNEGA